MRVVISEDKDAKDLMRRLELERIKRSGNQVKQQGDPIDDAHSSFHYVVVQWLQDQGFQL